MTESDKPPVKGEPTATAKSSVPSRPSDTAKSMAPGKPFVPEKPIVPSQTKQETDPRKITYRVGWKSGTIHTQDKGKAARPAPSGGTLSDFATDGSPEPEASAEEPGAASGRDAAEAPPASWIASQLLRPAPLPTVRIWPYILSVLPAAAFAALVWLAYRMSST